MIRIEPPLWAEPESGFEYRSDAGLSPSMPATRLTNFIIEAPMRALDGIVGTICALLAFIAMNAFWIPPTSLNGVALGLCVAAVLVGGFLVGMVLVAWLETLFG